MSEGAKIVKQGFNWKIRFIALCFALAVMGAQGAAAQSFQMERVATGLIEPVFVTAPPSDPSRVFILEQHTGAIRILDLNTVALLSTPFLTISNLSISSEGGLLGMAFHPNYAVNGFFYVYYTEPGTRVVRYTVSANPDVADSNSATDVLRFDQPGGNHNAGWIGFGPNDGYLYVNSGDGGGLNGNDDSPGHTPGVGNGQDITNNLLGKILRIDVDGDDFPGDALKNYAIPSGNPFVGITGDDEIWAYGLRNPWRASFDRLTGDFYIGDVGQATCEEINVNPGSNPIAGANYGWRLREGTIATPTGGVGGAAPAGAIDPVMDYPRNSGSSICSDPGSPFLGFSVTGGYAYRGPVAELQGRYFFADYVTARIWSFVWDGSDPALFDGSNYTNLTDHESDPRFVPAAGAIDNISTFGEDAAGNLYVADHGDGEIFRVPEPSLAAGTMAGFATAILFGALRRRRR